MAIYSNTVTVTNAGTPVPLLATQTRAAWVVIQSKSTNSGNIYPGGGGTKSASPLSGSTVAITSGNSLTLPWMGGAGTYNLNDIVVDADSSGAVVRFIYGKG
jgi:hypothetical protein